MWRGVIEEYRDRLPIDRKVRAVTLMEGNTPLIEASRLADKLGLNKNPGAIDPEREGQHSPHRSTAIG